ncbi:multidrug transporter AcrB [Malaciobacter pacificus]|uniref:RND family efflux system, inner membrane transporter, AcrB family n=1 Tax=Malaciobacter pacificus TaxID=1080223 RepID=A0A5C2H470_9BACT|nr:efflux RND transporter permease subunit [Malaciobacter pacificus]QEP33790.1 RND family efflux system, inner membrane transporter, AcrB family [Malaciobacter pacificus]GGD33368.1 multidrug transporter AcrB [Malaciobacter pacificus]
MNITSFALKNDKVTIVFSLLIFIYGVITFIDLPRAKDPGFIIRTATVVTYFPGASAKRVEQLVTDKLEKEIQQMSEIDFIKSTSKNGVSIIFVNILEKYKNMRPIWDSLRRKVQDGSRSLPQGTLTPIVNDEFGDVYGTLISIQSDGLSYRELEDISNDTKDIFLRLDDVAKIEILGIQNQAVYIEYDNSKLSSLNLSASYIKTILESKNIVLSGGNIKLEKNRLSIEPTGNYEDIEQIKNTLIPLNTGEKIYLKDIAKIRYEYKTPSNFIVQKDSKDAVLLAVSMKDDGDIIKLGEQIDALLVSVQDKLPLGVYLDRLFNEPKVVDRIVSNFVINLLQAMALVIIVMLFSLGFRTGMIVALLIPMSILLSFIIMSIFDIWLDQVSLAALIISLGLLVDSAIVMSESIMVLMQKGKSVVEASIKSANELKIPLLTSALTTSAAFLPIFLAKSTTGEYTNSIFKVVTITLLSSWVLALTLTPVLSKYFMKKGIKAKIKESFLSSFYKASLVFAISNKTVTLIVTIVLFIGSLLLFENVPKKFFPPSSESTFTVEINLPVGTAIETTLDSVKQIENFIKEKYMKEEKEVINFVSFIGESAPRFWLSYDQELASSEYSTILVNLKDTQNINEIRKDIEDFAKSKFPDMQISAKTLNMGPPVKKPIEIRISGKDIDKLSLMSSKIKQELSKIDGVVNISDDWGLKNKKIIVNIDESKALKEGISNLDIAVSLQTAVSGFEVTTFRKDDKLIPLILRSNENTKDDIDRLKTINVYSQSTGKNIPLSQVAKIDVVYEESKIIRRDRLKTITIGSAIKDGYNAIDVFDEIKPWLDEYSKRFDLGYFYEFGGEYEASAKANESIIVNLPIAFMVILLLMVAQFNSIRKPFIILTAIPLGIIGVSFGLFITNSYFGFMTLLGIISLSGIVINNAIVLLERIKLEQVENRLSPYDAVLQASLSRFRPIVLTTLTTVLGLVPLWYSGGIMWEPMAISIIFGLLVSTIFTLLFVPVLYSIFYKVKKV